MAIIGRAASGGPPPVRGSGGVGCDLIESADQRLERQQHAIVPALVRVHGRERRELGPEPARGLRRPRDRLAETPRRPRASAAGVSPGARVADHRGRRLAEQAAAHLVPDLAHPAIGKIEIQGHAIAAQRVVDGDAGVGRLEPRVAAWPLARSRIAW